LALRTVTFTAAFLARKTGAAPGTLETRYWKSWRTAHVNGQDTAEAGAPSGRGDLDAAAGLACVRWTKITTTWKKMNPPLHGYIIRLG